jgi:NAD+ synthase (glutamine-hydrolysing)
MIKKSSKIRIALAQVNPTVGDLAGNARKVRRRTAEAKALGCHIVAFPELMLSGYPPEDLLLKPRFLKDCDSTLHAVARDTKGIVVLLGVPEMPSRPGGCPYNACHVLSRGAVAATYRKINLPNYGVFDEKRYFEQGENALVVNLGGAAVGINICEDIWVDDGPTGAQVRLGGARIIVNISASPYHRGKGIEREMLMQMRARENGVYLCYLNLVGGQDELVFDGSSVIAAPDGTTIARAKAFEEDLLVADIETTYDRSEGTHPFSPSAGAHKRVEIVDVPAPTSVAGKRAARPGAGPRARKGAAKPALAKLLEPVAEVYRALVLGTRDYVDKNGFAHVVLGVSGGVDSALVASLAVDALGKDRVTGVTMPSQYSSKATLRDARAICRNLGVEMIELPIDPIYESYLASMRPAFKGRRMDVTEENIQARIRGNLLMALSNKFGWLVLTTGNKSELAVGYCTLYGDMAGGFAVIKDVPKTLVYPLCRYRNARSPKPVIPGSILRRRPSAELRPNQLDEDTLPPYRILDRIIELYVEHDMSLDEIIARGLDPATVRRTLHMIDSSEYKRRQGAPGIKITPKAFGRDRRLPITNRYRGAEKR